MQDSLKIYIDLSESDQIYLAENNISLSDLLKENGISAIVSHDVMPVDFATGQRTKDVVPVIVASSALLVAIGYVISSTLRTIFNRPRLVEYYDLIPEGAENSIDLSVTSNRAYRKVKKYELLQPGNISENSSVDFSIGGAEGIVIKFGSEIGESEKK